MRSGIEIRSIIVYCLFVCLFKIFKIKCSVLGEIHKKELLSLDKKHKKEFDDLRLQTSRIGANMRSESKLVHTHHIVYPLHSTHTLP